MPAISPSTNSVLKRTYDNRRYAKQTKKTKMLLGFFILIAFSLYVEIHYESPVLSRILPHPIVWYLERVAFLLCIVVCVIEFLMFITLSCSTGVVEMTAMQKILLGIKDTDSGFNIVTRTVTSPHDGNLVFAPCNTPTAPINPRTIASPGYSPTNQPISPQNLNTSNGIFHGSPNSSLTQSHSNSYIHNISDLLNQSGAGGSFLSSSQGSGMGGGVGGSVLGGPSVNAGYSPYTSQQPNNSGLRYRTSVSSAHVSFDSSMDTSMHRRNVNMNVSSTDDGCLNDMSELDTFLKEQKEKDYKMQLGSPEKSPGNSAPSFWSYGRQLVDYTGVLSRSKYQASCSSPQTQAIQGNDMDDGVITYQAQQVWTRLGIHEDKLALWVERLRKWIGQTMMHRLSQQILLINEKLSSMGCEELQIGETSISTLKQIAVTKSQHVPTLNDLIPFLEASATQQYLVKRILELSTGGCIGMYNWDGGSTFKDKPWGEHLPTDSAIIMHIFCTYMDMHLPPDPKFPDNKMFTAQHFMKTPDKPVLEKGNLLIYQSKMTPPHYKVVIDDDTYIPPKGRNNLFYAMLIFLHRIHQKENGMLGRVNLGMSGINILYVLED